MDDNNRSIVTLHHLLDYEVSKFTAAEILLNRNLEKWIDLASSFQLKVVLQKYHEFILEHVEKLEDFIKTEKLTSVNISDQVMKAFVEEAKEKMNYCTDTEVRDACLLASIQVINHFKISEYGTAAAFAKALDMEKAATIFHQMEINEKHIDDRLSQLAEYEINIRARTPIVLAEQNKDHQ